MKHILLRLFDFQYLTREEAKELLFAIVRGELADTQVASIITSFLMRSISVDEVLGFREALMEMCVPVALSEYRPLDIVGTGGDEKNTFNISTASCFVVAGAGYKVVKHGNYGATSVSGASNVMENLGVKFSTDIDALRRSIEETNVAYLHAPLFSPALKAVAPVRKSLGVRTFFNVLGPLVNPVEPEYQMLGVYNLAMLRLYSYIYQAGNKHFTIVHSLDGYDEISLTSRFKVVSKKGEQMFYPEQIGLKTCEQHELFGGNTIDEAAAIFSKVMNGTATEAQTNAVLVNSAFGIHTIEADKSIEECLEIARESLFGKRAAKALAKFIELNKG